MKIITMYANNVFQDQKVKVTNILGVKLIKIMTVGELQAEFKLTLKTEKVKMKTNDLLPVTPLVILFYFKRSNKHDTLIGYTIIT